MAERKTRRGGRTDEARAPEPGDEDATPQYCSVPITPEPVLAPDLPADRVSVILSTRDRWANGTVIHYYFYDQDTDGLNVTLKNGTKEWRTWVGAEDQREIVRKGFHAWKELGIGLEFREVDTRDEAEVRIGFMQGDGSWSYVGTQVLDYGPAKRTMNFGWRLQGSSGLDTAIHEIGHTLGLNHEHQNPNAGIVWNEPAVYEDLSGPPNNWTDEKIHYNILRKIPPDEVQGSSWDPDSVMHYPFKAGLIAQPEKFRTQPLRPRGGLSERDRAWIRTFYPPLDEASFGALTPGRSEVLAIAQGEQQDFVIQPDATRHYTIHTFGSCDTLLALFVERDGEPRYVTADDDSGENRNASVRVKLVKGEKYILRVQLRYADLTAPPGVLMW